MFAHGYEAAINYAAENAPALPLEPGKTNNFFEWAEYISGLLAFIFSNDPEDTLEDLVEAVKEEQGYEDE